VRHRTTAFKLLIADVPGVYQQLHKRFASKINSMTQTVANALQNRTALLAVFGSVSKRILMKVGAPKDVRRNMCLWLKRKEGGRDGEREGEETMGSGR
jgi:hypothetical protein